MSDIDLLAAGFALARAPVVDRAGALYVADTLAGGIRVLRPEGGERHLLPGRRGIGGMALHAGGNLLVSGRDVAAVDVTDPDAAASPVLTDLHATSFNGLAAGPAGELLAGLQRYHPARGEPPTPGALRIADRTGTTHDMSGTVLWPNGVVVGQEWLYLSDFATGTVLRARWGEDGVLQPWWSSPSQEVDGLAMDAQGAVLVALGNGGAVARVRPDGTTDALLAVPAAYVAGVCFRNDDVSQLIVTTAKNTEEPALDGCVFGLTAPAPGAPVPEVAVAL